MGITEYPQIPGVPKGQGEEGGHYLLPWELVWGWEKPADTPSTIPSFYLLTNPRCAPTSVLRLSDKIGSQTLIPTTASALPRVGVLETFVGSLTSKPLVSLSTFKPHEPSLPHPVMKN